MRSAMVCLAALLCSWAAPHSVAGETAIDWSQWRSLAVQNGGRQKPLDTLGWETLRMLSNRGRLTDPDTHAILEPTAAYLAMLLDWQGWDHPDRAQLLLSSDWREDYFRLHQPDRWDQMPLLLVDLPQLRTALALDPQEKRVSPLRLAQARITDAQTGEDRRFTSWARDLLPKDQDQLTLLQRKGLELADRLWSYQNHRMGHTMEIVPAPNSEEGLWLPIAYLMLGAPQHGADKGLERLEPAHAALAKVRQAYLAKDGASFQRASAEFLRLMQTTGPQFGAYPDQSRLNLEVAYNHWVPFRIAWVLTLLAFVCMLAAASSQRSILYVTGIGLHTAALAAVAVGFALRVVISGRAPVTNMYESVIYVGAGAAVLGLIFEIIYRKRYILAAAAAVATVTLVLADNCPTVLDPSVQPLQPVLRSNFWLVTHVMTITLSYAAFALALGIANITLGHYLVGSTKREAIATLSKFTYKALQVGVLLLAAGIILGGVWADYSWGRFWGWDPKEVWALIALLGYLAVLHARYAGWVRHLGTAALSACCFSLVVMAWYGVNFVLGAGLHSYGFGGGGQGYVYGGVGLQLLLVAAAVVRGTRLPTPPGVLPIPAASAAPSAAAAGERNAA